MSCQTWNNIITIHTTWLNVLRIDNFRSHCQFFKWKLTSTAREKVQKHLETHWKFLLFKYVLQVSRVLLSPPVKLWSITVSLCKRKSDLDIHRWCSRLLSGAVRCSRVSLVYCWSGISATAGNAVDEPT